MQFTKYQLLSKLKIRYTWDSVLWCCKNDCLRSKCGWMFRSISLVGFYLESFRRSESSKEEMEQRFRILRSPFNLLFHSGNAKANFLPRHGLLISPKIDVWICFSEFWMIYLIRKLSSMDVLKIYALFYWLGRTKTKYSISDSLLPRIISIILVYFYYLHSSGIRKYAIILGFKVKTVKQRKDILFLFFVHHIILGF